jgi:hypothetical protein
MTFHEQIRRPASASTEATRWSQNTSASLGHRVPQRHMSIVKGDVNFVGNTLISSNHTDNVPSSDITDMLEQLSRSTSDTNDHENVLEFVYDLFYMHSLYNHDDLRVARLLIEGKYASIVQPYLMTYMTQGIFSTTTNRRSTQYILYTLWNFTGVSIEFRFYLSNQQTLIEFLLDDFVRTLIDMKSNGQFVCLIDNLIQSIVSILHNLTLNINRFNVEPIFDRVNNLLVQHVSNNGNERLRVTLLLCLIHLHPEHVHEYLNHSHTCIYRATLKLLFRFLKKTVQQECLMISTGLSAWLLVYAINKLSVDIILQDDTRVHSLMILFKRGMYEEKRQACLALNRCLKQSIHVKDIIEKDVTCWNLFQQYRLVLDDEQD